MYLHKKSDHRFWNLKKQSGQIVVEYVLLLAVAVSMAVIAISVLVKRSDDVEDSGALIKRWLSIQQKIGSDTPP